MSRARGGGGSWGESGPARKLDRPCCVEAVVPDLRVFRKRETGLGAWRGEGQHLVFVELVFLQNKVELETQLPWCGSQTMGERVERMSVKRVDRSRVVLGG